MGLFGEHAALAACCYLTRFVGSRVCNQQPFTKGGRLHKQTVKRISMKAHFSAIEDARRLYVKRLFLRNPDIWTCNVNHRLS